MTKYVIAKSETNVELRCEMRKFSFLHLRSLHFTSNHHHVDGNCCTNIYFDCSAYEGLEPEPSSSSTSRGSLIFHNLSTAHDGLILAYMIQDDEFEEFPESGKPLTAEEIRGNASPPHLSRSSAPSDC